mgnify:CR=1 FL=1
MNNPKTAISREHLEDMLAAADSETKIFWGKELVTSYRLPSGFTVLGRAACVDPENFVRAVGIEIAKDDALNQLWKLEGYVLQLKLAGMIEDMRDSA